MKKDRVQKLTESGLLLPVHTIKIMRTAYNKKGGCDISRIKHFCIK